MITLRTFASSCALALAASIVAQQPGTELVRNGGFENLDKVVSTYDQFPSVSAWKNATLGLPEVFQKGASVKTIGIPTNDYGTMEPLEGERYAGFFGWKDDVRFNMNSADPEEVFRPGWNAYSEYLHNELVAPLQRGKTYEVVFHVALSGNSDRTILGLGTYASKIPVYENHRKFLEYVPDVYLKDMVREKGKWTEVRGRFKAQGGEQYLVIGIFPYVGLESERLIEGLDNRYAYYYIDAVSLKEVDPEAE